MTKDRTITERNARYRRKLAEERGLKRIEVVVPVDAIEEIQALARRLRRKSELDYRPNAETVNDRVKLLYHRAISRRLKREPGLAAEALKALERRAEQFGRDDDTEEWRALLRMPIDEIRRTIGSRSREAARIRIASPFPFVRELSIAEPHVRRRLWKVANRAFARSRTSTVRSVP